jgi:hypothetical protein
MYLDETALKVSVNYTRRLGGTCAAGNCPRAHFRFTSGEKIHQVEHAVADLYNTRQNGDCSPGFRQEGLLRCGIVLHLPQLLFPLHGHRNDKTASMGIDPFPYRNEPLDQGGKGQGRKFKRLARKDEEFEELSTKGERERVCVGGGRGGQSEGLPCWPFV